MVDLTGKRDYSLPELPNSRLSRLGRIVYIASTAAQVTELFLDGKLLTDFSDAAIERAVDLAAAAGKSSGDCRREESGHLGSGGGKAM